MDGPESVEAGPQRARRRLYVIAGMSGLIAIAGAVPALQWQRAEAAKTSCLATERRLSTALLLYAQDHDSRLPPPDYPAAPGRWRNWVGVLQPYIDPSVKAVCPLLNPSGAVELRNGYPYPFSYALNMRFYGDFFPGPFPLENLELSAQTVMLVESGPVNVSRSPDPAPRIFSIYRDVASARDFYPSPHGGRMNVAAADGHVVTLKIAHYVPNGHDSQYGRLGGSIYNWNGGHPNGDTGGPPRE